MGSLIRSTNLWGFDALVRDLGGDPKALRGELRLPMGIEDRDDAFVEFASHSRLLESAARSLRCPDFGLRLVEWQGMRILGPIAVIARNAVTVGAGIEAIARYLHVHSPALHLWTEGPVSSGEPGEVFRYEIRELPLDLQQQAYELSLANAVRIVRLLSGDDTGPVRISFHHAQLGPDDAYERTLGCPVDFEADWCGFVVSQEVLERPIDSADPETRRVATSYLEAAYPAPGAELSAQVAELVRKLLPTGHYSGDVVAEQLHLHQRTLQRQLADEGVTYAEILDSQRRDLAAHYLAEPKLPIGQISALLGYTEQSALNRAFKRWFGISPRAYRLGLGS